MQQLQLLYALIIAAMLQSLPATAQDRNKITDAIRISLMSPSPKLVIESVLINHTAPATEQDLLRARIAHCTADVAQEQAIVNQDAKAGAGLAKDGRRNTLFERRRNHLETKKNSLDSLKALLPASDNVNKDYYSCLVHICIHYTDDIIDHYHYDQKCYDQYYFLDKNYKIIFNRKANDKKG